MYVHLDLYVKLMRRCYGGVGVQLPFRPIAQCQNELQEDTAEIEILQHRIDDWCDTVAKRKGALIVCFAWGSDEIHDDTSREPERS